MTLRNSPSGPHILVFAIVAFGFARVLLAQPAEAACTRPAVKCGPFVSGPTYTSLSIVNGYDANNQKVCKFAEHTLLPLETEVGYPSHWSICSACDLEASVELFSWSDTDLGTYLENFRPIQDPSNVIQSGLIACHTDNAGIEARAKSATPFGGLNYKARVVSATGVVTDIIDPQLQIKRGGTLNPVKTVLWVLLGAAAGFGLARFGVGTTGPTPANERADR